MKTLKTSTPLFTRRLYSAAADAIRINSIAPIRPLFEKRGPAFDACLRRLDNGQKPAVFVEGNGKLPFFSFSSLPGIDCPGAGECLYGASGEVMGGFCYSFRAWRYPAAFIRQLVNSLRLRTPEGRAEISAEWFALPHGATVRLYVDGDFYSLECFAFWMRLCFARPDLRVYGYSKSWGVIREYNLGGNQFPTNYFLNLSSGGSGGDSLREIVSRYPITRGEFIAVKTAKDHGKAYQSARNPGFLEYSRDVRANAPSPRTFVCRGKCGDCTPRGHACGLDSFRGIPIAIGMH